MAMVAGFVLLVFGTCAWLGKGRSERTLSAVVGSEVAASRRRQRDEAMLARLADLRIPTPGFGRAARARSADAAYAAAFEAYLGGGWLLERSPEAALFALGRGGITLKLAAALNLWGLARACLPVCDVAARADTARLRLLAELLHPHEPARAHLRALLPHALEDGASLRGFAEEADPAALRAPGCLVLAEALALAGERAAAVAWLRRARGAHPRDFELTLALASALEQLEEPRRQEALALYRLAHSLRSSRTRALHCDAAARPSRRD